MPGPIEEVLLRGLAKAGEGCLPRDIAVSVTPAGRARSYSGTFSVPDIDGNCTANVGVSAEDLAHNTGTGTTSLAIAEAMQKLSISISSPVSGHGDVVSDPSGIKCFAGSNDGCSMIVPRNQAVTLFAQEGREGVGFDTWKGSDVCSGVEPTCRLVMDKDHNEVANFLQLILNSAVGTPAVPTTVVPSPAATGQSNGNLALNTAGYAGAHAKSNGHCQSDKHASRDGYCNPLEHINRISAPVSDPRSDAGSVTAAHLSARADSAVGTPSVAVSVTARMSDAPNTL